MQLDTSKMYYVYPSWAHYSYKWTDLPTLLADPLNTPYLKGRNDWFDLGWSHETKNFELLSGPFGNGIIIKDESAITDARDKWAWLPGWILMREAHPVAPGMGNLPKDDPRFDRIRCLSPKESDEAKLGLEKPKKDYTPYFSLEPSDGLEGCALLCVTRTGASALTEDLEQLPAFFLAFEIKCELLHPKERDSVQKCEHIQGFIKKWNLNGTWYFVDLSGYDLGLLFAIVAYMGCWLRHQIGSRSEDVV